MHQCISINTGIPKDYVFDRMAFSSALVKTTSSVSRFLSKLSLEGDVQADTKHHGGLEKAALLYSFEHYRYWEERLSRKLPYGSFGETFTTVGLTEETVSIGDIYRIGEAIVQVSQPRRPCYKFGYIYGEKEMPIWIEQTGKTGIYVRVLQEGVVVPSGEIELLEKGAERFTVDFINRLLVHDKQNLDAMEEALQLGALSPNIKRVFKKQLASEFENHEARYFGH